ncbi:MAG: hypothetical protein J5965_20625 [Aeriscardovia sp.]|nr:hypothetical protein [Aeriscardovia sp.]
MSRLQVGGLAINLNSGKIVTLVKFLGDMLSTPTKKTYKSVWHVKANEFHVLHDDSMKLEFGVPASELLPLGDKQTQDEFKKELDLCHEN